MCLCVAVPGWFLKRCCGTGVGKQKSQRDVLALPSRQQTNWESASDKHSSAALQCFANCGIPHDPFPMCSSCFAYSNNQSLHLHSICARTGFDLSCSCTLNTHSVKISCFPALTKSHWWKDLLTVYRYVFNVLCTWNIIYSPRLWWSETIPKPGGSLHGSRLSDVFKGAASLPT